MGSGNRGLAWKHLRPPQIQVSVNMSIDALEENVNCLETHARFQISGDDLIPQTVTNRLGIEPSSSWAKGDLLPSRSGTIRRRTGTWMLESEGRLQTTSLERHVLFLLTDLEPRAAVICAFLRETGFEASFACYWMSSSNHGGPIVSNDTVRRISQLGASIWFDFYCSE